MVLLTSMMTHVVDTGSEKHLLSSKFHDSKVVGLFMLHFLKPLSPLLFSLCARTGEVIHVRAKIRTTADLHVFHSCIFLDFDIMFQVGAQGIESITIYNPTADAVALDNYSIATKQNSTSEYSHFKSVSTSDAQVNSGETYTICLRGANTSVTTDLGSVSRRCNQSASFGEAVDRLFLMLGPKALPSSTSCHVVIDQFGHATSMDSSTTTGFVVCGQPIANTSFVRKSTVVQGETNFSSSAGTNASNCQWRVALQGTTAVQEAASAGTYTCILPNTCTPALVNGDMEADDQGWVGSHLIIITQNGSASWGSLHSGDATYYAALQRNTSAIQQNISGFITGQFYQLNFLAADRPAYNYAILVVSIISVNSGDVIASRLIDFLPPTFSSFSLAWNISRSTDSTLTVRFENTSPEGVCEEQGHCPEGNRTAFVDDVFIGVCGTNAPPTVVNGDFEDDEYVGGYEYRIPSDWDFNESKGDIIVIRNGNQYMSWGGLDSGDGMHYVALQHAPATLQQNISGFEIGVEYQLSFLTAHRPNNHNATLIASILSTCATIAMHVEDPMPANFTTVTLNFIATAESLTLQFVNDSPQYNDSDYSVFLDNVNVDRLSKCATLCTNTTLSPTSAPTTLAPTLTPSTQAPTTTPTTLAPTMTPSTKAPTATPTTLAPTMSPSTQAPTATPITLVPIITPTTSPTSTVPVTDMPMTGNPSEFPQTTLISHHQFPTSRFLPTEAAFTTHVLGTANSQDLGPNDANSKTTTSDSPDSTENKTAIYIGIGVGLFVSTCLLVVIIGRRRESAKELLQAPFPPKPLVFENPVYESSHSTDNTVESDHINGLYYDPRQINFLMRNRMHTVDAAGLDSRQYAAKHHEPRIIQVTCANAVYDVPLDGTTYGPIHSEYHDPQTLNLPTTTSVYDEPLTGNETDAQHTHCHNSRSLKVASAKFEFPSANSTYDEPLSANADIHPQSQYDDPSIINMPSANFGAPSANMTYDEPLTGNGGMENHSHYHNPRVLSLQSVDVGREGPGSEGTDTGYMNFAVDYGDSDDYDSGDPFA